MKQMFIEMTAIPHFLAEQQVFYGSECLKSEEIIKSFGINKSSLKMFYKVISSFNKKFEVVCPCLIGSMLFLHVISTNDVLYI